jgi:hypothetical protein
LNYPLNDNLTFLNGFDLFNISDPDDAGFWRMTIPMCGFNQDTYAKGKYFTVRTLPGSTLLPNFLVLLISSSDVLSGQHLMYKRGLRLYLKM